MRENICFQQIRIVNLSACHALEPIRHDFIGAPILSLWSLIQRQSLSNLTNLFSTLSSCSQVNHTWKHFSHGKF